MLASARRHARKALSPTRYYVLGLAKRIFSNPVPVWCQAIAFKVLVTMLPLILLATGIFGLVLRQPNPFETVAGYLRTFLPAGQGESLVQMVFELQKASSALTVLGAGFFMLTVVTMFGTVRHVVTQAVGTDRRETRSFFQGFVFDLRMAAQVGLLFLLTFGLTFAINTLSVQTTAWGQSLGLDPATLEQGWSVILRLVALLVPWLISVAMFAQLFYFIPRPHPPLRSALLGASVTALLFEGAKNGFTFYARYVGGFDRYGGGANTEGGALGSLGGIFGLILVLVFWVYLSGLMLVIGAMVTALHEDRHQPRRSAMRRLWRTLHRKRSEERRGTKAPPAAPEAISPEPAEVPRAAPVTVPQESTEA